jgi:hypothetical protein
VSHSWCGANVDGKKKMMKKQRSKEKGMTGKKDSCSQKRSLNLAGRDNEGGFSGGAMVSDRTTEPNEDRADRTNCSLTMSIFNQCKLH